MLATPFCSYFELTVADLTTELRKRQVDPLEAGIEVIARPPGKQPVSISQLSGGEKAMTCIALLMSIFKSKPSPFCILDEVDAPLDEANIGRLMRLLREMSASTQFIIITHSKKTMESAQAMYGVTMQEPGVSKLVGQPPPGGDDQPSRRHRTPCR